MRFHEQSKYIKATTWQESCDEWDIWRWFSEHMPLSRERLSLLITSPWNYTDSGRIKPSGSTFGNYFGQKIEIKNKKRELLPCHFQTGTFWLFQKTLFSVQNGLRCLKSKNNHTIQAEMKRFCFAPGKSWQSALTFVRLGEWLRAGGVADSYTGNIYL